MEIKTTILAGNEDKNPGEDNPNPGLPEQEQQGSNSEEEEDDLPENTFESGGKQYKVKLSKVNIPTIGVRTALEICADKDVQALLLSINCIGSVLEELVD